MADYLAAKGTTETVERRWAIPVTEGDHAASVAIVATGVTASAEVDDGHVVLTISGGTAGATASIVVTVGTDLNNTLVETLYIPVILTTGAGVTVRDIVNFALRKVNGLGEDASSDQAADALDHLSDMIEEWRVTGADLGAPRPLELATVLQCPHSHVSAIKSNLIVRLSDLYERAITPSVAVAAIRGLQLIKTSNLARAKVEFF